MIITQIVSLNVQQQIKIKCKIARKKRQQKKNDKKTGVWLLKKVKKELDKYVVEMCVDLQKQMFKVK